MVDLYKREVFSMNIEYYSTEREFYKDKNTNDAYIWESDSELPLIRFKSLDKFNWLGAFFSTRRGGVSTGCLSTLNLGFSRGDSQENVKENYLRIGRKLGINMEKMIVTNQVHSTNIIYAEEKYSMGSEFTRKLENTDGLYTDKKGLILSTTFADCVPLFFADDERKVIAATHSGWRGTVEKIGAKTVETLIKEGSSPENITVVIGPSICPECFEVGREVADEFEKNFDAKYIKDIIIENTTKRIYKTEDITCGMIAETSKENLEHSQGNIEQTQENLEQAQETHEHSQENLEQTQETHEHSQENLEQTQETHEQCVAKPHIDLWAACYWQLVDAGIKKENIYFSGMCSSCNKNELFSHRATGGKRGNMNAFIYIK